MLRSSLPNPARRGKPRQGLGQGAVGGGELVHQAACGAAPQAVADGSSPSRFPKLGAVAPPKNSASLRLCFSALKTTEGGGVGSLTQRKQSGGDAEGAGLEWNTDCWQGFANAPP